MKAWVEEQPDYKERKKLHRKLLDDYGFPPDGKESIEDKLDEQKHSGPWSVNQSAVGFKNKKKNVKE